MFVYELFLWFIYIRENGNFMCFLRILQGLKKEKILMGELQKNEFCDEYKKIRVKI